MTDGQSLFLIFAVLYLLECVRWLPGSALVITGAGKHWRLRKPLAQAEIAGLHPVLLPFLPPPQVHVVMAPWVLAPCDEGLEVCTDDARTEVLPWEALKPRVEGSRLHLTDRQTVRFTTEEKAAEWRQRVADWQSAAPQERSGAFLKYARQSLEIPPLGKRALRLSRQTRWLRWLGGAIFIWTFGTVAATYRWFGEGVEVFAAAGVLLILLWTQAVVFWCSAKRGQPVPPHRFWKALAIAFLPQHAMRAADLMCRVQPAAAHPLAARELLNDTDWRRLAAEFWKQARHSQAKSAPLQLQALEAFFRKQGINPADLEEVPKREGDSAAYCPRCLAQYRDAGGVCQDCGGVALKEWPAA